MNTKIETRQFSGMKNRDAFFAWLNPEMPLEDKYRRERLLSEYAETNEEVYWYFLEILPPMKWERNHFAISEATTGDVRLAFFKVGGRYFAAHISDRIGAHDIDATHAEIANAIGRE